MTSKQSLSVHLGEFTIWSISNLRYSTVRSGQATNALDEVQLLDTLDGPAVVTVIGRQEVDRKVCTEIYQT